MNEEEKRIHQQRSLNNLDTATPEELKRAIKKLKKLAKKDKRRKWFIA